MTITMALSLVLPFTAFAEAGTDTNLGSLTIMKYERDPALGIPMADFEGGTQTTPTVDDDFESHGQTPVEGVEYTIERVESFDGKNWVEVTGETPIAKTTNAEGKIVFDN